MPVKSSDETQKLYIIAPDGTRHEFSGIQSIEATSYDADKVADDLNMNRRIFHVDLMMLPNNFRRMHGHENYARSAYSNTGRT